MQSQNQPLLNTPEEYRMSFLWTGNITKFLVKGFPGITTNRSNLQMHLMHPHVKDTIIILNKGTTPHLQCKQ